MSADFGVLAMPTILAEHLPYFVHYGALLYLVCFIFRDQILLRSFAIAGDLANTVYFYGGTGTALWAPLFWCMMNISINLVMIGIILNDQRHAGMSDDELSLFRKLDALTPGDFRKLIRIGKWHRAPAETVLTEQTKEVDRLFYVLEGDIDIEKSGRSIHSPAGLFIGEIAFLRGRPATATVKVGEGAHYFEWRKSDLQRLFDKQPDLRNAFASLLNADMAEKVARS
jgi:hypothetical protein